MPETSVLENARTLLAKVRELIGAGYSRTAHVLAKQAIATLEPSHPDSEELAAAYRAMCFVHLKVRCRPNKREEHNQAAVAWYEKAIAVWRRNGNQSTLAGNLVNLGSIYYRFSNFERALACNLQGLELERQSTQLDAESVAAWNHVAGCYLALGRHDEAEDVVQDGFRHFGKESVSAGYLWSTLAKIHSAKAEQCHQQAEKLLPAGSCAL